MMIGKHVKLYGILTGLLLLPAAVVAGNDPGIKGDLRSNIYFAMNQFIEGQTIEGRMYNFDAIGG